MKNEQFEQLTGGLYRPSISSSYTEAFPFQASVIAINDMDVTGSSLPKDWVEALLESRIISYQFRPPIEQVDKIRHLYFESINKEKLSSDGQLGFGYPILIKKDNKTRYGISAIPIFIWAAEIAPNEEEFALWSLTAKKPLHCFVNPVLKSISPRIKELVESCAQTIEKTNITGFLCNEFCQRLAQTLKYQNERPVYGLDSFPILEDILSVPSQGHILWSGIFSQFPPITTPTYREEVSTKEYWQEKNVSLASSPVQLDYLINDHHQKAAQAAINKHSFVNIEAPMGTGKTHLLINVLVQNLMNQRTTLIVGSNQAALSKVATRLKEKGLKSYTYRFRNLQQDKDRLIELLTPKVVATSKLKKQPTNKEFDKNYGSFLQISDHLNSVAAHFGKNVFDINNRAETIGLFLRNNKSTAKDLLAGHLEARDFKFSMTEFAQLQAKLEKTKTLFKPHFSFRHALTDLSKETFLYPTKVEAKEIVTEQVVSFLSKARSIQQQALLGIGAYKDELERHYYQYEKTLKNRLAVLEQQVAAFGQQFDGQYTKTSLGNLKLKKVFSQKPAKVLPEKRAILHAYEEFKQIFAKDALFDFSFNVVGDGDLDRIQAELLSFREAFQSWQQQYRLDLPNSTKHLNSHTAFESIDFKERLAAVELSIDTLVKDINAIPLFLEPLINGTGSLRLQIQVVEDIIERLEYTQYHLRDFEDYYEWRQHTQVLTPLESKVVNAVITVQPKDWSSAFKSWYFEHLLTEEPAQDVDYDGLVGQYLSKYDNLYDMIPTFIRANWAAQNWSIIQDLKREGTAIASLIEPLADSYDLQNYFRKHFAAITKFFPIQLMTATTFETLTGNEAAISWDTLMLIDAANFNKEQGYSLINKAEQVVVFGTGNVGPWPSYNSFWELSKKIASKTLYLKQQHHTTPLPLLHFTNTVYKHRLQLPNLKPESDVSLQCYHTNGLYNEADKTNEQEATAILELLVKIYQTNTGRLPKMGIACASSQQRDFIAYQFLKIKQASASNSDILEAFYKQGMGLFTFAELAGQFFDTLLVSLTYGAIDRENRLTTHLESYNTVEGEYMLQNLLTSDTRNMYVFNSIPIIYRELHQAESKESGLYLYYNFLEYLVANQNTNRHKLDKILQRLQSEPRSLEEENNKSAFIEEVATYLKAYFEEPSRIATNVILNNIQYPMLIKSSLKRKKSYILLVDSYAKNAEAFSFVWQRQAQQALEAQGYEFIQIWSKDWWKNPEEEARQLAKVIIRADNDFD